MIWLAIHMWALLFAAFAIGVGTGLWIRASRNDDRETGDAPLGTLDADAPLNPDRED
ncbi:MAG: hypothetical protein AAFW81_03590 [Pseudomonadota bacterium]